MAARGWGGSIATAVGVAAGAGAAQLGLGYGLGIIAWLPSADGASEAAWVASLTWAVWIAATSTILGAILAQRLDTASGAQRLDTASGAQRLDTASGAQRLDTASGAQRLDAASGDGPAVGGARHGEPPRSTGGTLWRISLAAAAAMGALLTVALVAVPARAATRADTFSPQTIAAGYAVLGVLLGLLVAIWALHSPAVSTNIIATAGWLWLLAVVAVISGVAAGRGLATAQLGVWQITADGGRFWFRDYFYWPGATLALGSALLIGALAARSAARSARTRVGAAVSGGVGPLLVALAYFLAAPRLVGIGAEQLSAHLMAPYAVIAGLAGSALVASFAQRREFAPDRTEADRYRSDRFGDTPDRGDGGQDGGRFDDGAARDHDDTARPGDGPGADGGATVGAATGRATVGTAGRGQTYPSEPDQTYSGSRPTTTDPAADDAAGGDGGPAAGSGRFGRGGGKGPGKGLRARMGRQREPGDEPPKPVGDGNATRSG
nr:hypothetical protein [Micromonospora sp. DSM 115978]